MVLSVVYCFYWLLYYLPSLVLSAVGRKIGQGQINMVCLWYIVFSDRTPVSGLFFITKQVYIYKGSKFSWSKMSRRLPINWLLIYNKGSTKIFSFQNIINYSSVCHLKYFSCLNIGSKELLPHCEIKIDQNCSFVVQFWKHVCLSCRLKLLKWKKRRFFKESVTEKSRIRKEIF